MEQIVDDELDYIENLCGVKPKCFLSPNEWIGNDGLLPFEQRDSGYQKLRGCYAFCGVDCMPDDRTAESDDGPLNSITFLYIGKAVRLRARMSEHMRDGLQDKSFDWCRDNDQLLMIAFWLSDDRNALESKLIRSLKPLWNRVLDP